MNDASEYVKRLEDRCAQMSYVLGMIHVGLAHFDNHKDMPKHLKQAISDMMSFVDAQVVDLFYKDEVNADNKA